MSDNAAPIILLTRPRPAADRFAAACGDRFGDRAQVVIAPLMEIVATGTLPGLAGVSGLIFTSEAGVAAFGSQSPRRDLPAWCVGDRTSEAAAALGLSARSANGTADDLVAMIVADAVFGSGKLLHVRGVHTRGDVVARLESGGIAAEDIALYDQKIRAPDAAFDRTLRSSRPLLIPVFSPRSAHLVATAVGPRPKRAHVVAISTAAKSALPDDWQATCRLAQTPTAKGVLDAMATLI